MLRLQIDILDNSFSGWVAGLQHICMVSQKLVVGNSLSKERGGERLRKKIELKERREIKGYSEWHQKIFYTVQRINHSFNQSLIPSSPFRSRGHGRVHVSTRNISTAATTQRTLTTTSTDQKTLLCASEHRNEHHIYLTSKKYSGRLPSCRYNRLQLMTVEWEGLRQSG